MIFPRISEVYFRISFLTLIWVGSWEEGGGGYCFSLNNSETVRAVTLVCCSIHQLFITLIRAKFGISQSPRSLDISQNPDGGISTFQTSGQSFINKNCHNSRTLKLRQVTKLDDIMTCLQMVTLCHFSNLVIRKPAPIYGI